MLRISCALSLLVILGCKENLIPVSFQLDARPQDSSVSNLDAQTLADAAEQDAGTIHPDAQDFVDADGPDGSVFLDAEFADANADRDATAQDVPAFTDANSFLDASPPDTGPNDTGPLDTGPVMDGGTLALNPNPLVVVLGETGEISVNAPAGAVIVWAVDGQNGGSASTGTITARADPRNAIYTAPRTPSQVPPAMYLVSASAVGETASADIALEFPRPQVLSASPSIISAGSISTVITLTGSRFLPQTTITFAGASMVVTQQSWTELSFEVPDTMLELPGTRTVIVSSPPPGGGTATTDVDVIVRELILPVDVDPAAPSLFAAAAVSANVNNKPVITYPEHATIVPRDFPEPTLSWSQSSNVNTCRASITGQDIDVQIFTRSEASVLGPWENPYILIESRIWQLIIFQFHTIDIVIEIACGEITSTGGQATLTNNLIEVSDPISYQISTDGAGGRIVYFSGYENGLVRIDIAGSVFQRVNWLGPTPLFDSQTTECVGCHSFTGDGDLVSYSTFDARFGTSQINNGMLNTVLPLAQPQSAEWSVIHPDGQYLAAIDSSHRLNLHDTTNGALISTVSTSSIAPLVTQVFWSPVGDKIVFVASSTAGAEGVLSVEEGTIWALDFSTATGTPTFSNPQQIVGPQTIGGNAFYPSFSPDGEWIAFCRAPSGQSYSNRQSELWLIKSDTTVGPIALGRANMAPELYNAWPRWAPTITQGKYWLIFSSHRSYGPYIDGGPQQLWISRIDTNLLPNDPSYPALWLEGQNPFAGNLTAEWSINQ
jgi:hypothetical protein